MIHPVGDKIKVRVANRGYMGTASGAGRESGVVVEVPDELLYLGFHSFAFEGSIANTETLDRTHDFYKKFLNKIVYWEALQDRGRRFEEDGEEFVLLNMTDILAYDDGEGASAKMIDDVRSGGFNVGAAL